MYIQKEVKRGYNEYLRLDDNNGQGTYMDVGLLILEPGDSYTFEEAEKEVSWLLVKGKATASYEGKTVEMERPNPFDYAPYCMLQARGHRSVVTANAYSEIYVQKTLNERDYESHLYLPEETDTWARGVGELDGMMRRDVRTCYDYEMRPDSNMVLGEVINRPGKWSSYPPHSHPQPEVYFYFFEDPRGFGAGWVSGQPHEIHHHGCLLITDETPHQQVMAPGYPCCYTWGIRHLPGNPWEKTRNDDPTHTWLLEKDPRYWRGTE